MSGIVGYIGKKQAAPILTDALLKLEYRGNDSSGIAVYNNGQFEVRKELGGVKKLEYLLSKEPVSGTVGIGHTRWATHGKVSIENAHPQIAGKIGIVHNGIIENFVELREKLIKQGREFLSETDTEVLAQLIDSRDSLSLEDSVTSALQEIKGTYALAAFSLQDPEKIVTATRGNSISIGLGAGEFFIASDITAIVSFSKDAIFLSEGELAVITREGVDVIDCEGKRGTKEIKRVSWNPVMIEKGGYRHFFMKEICEQPRSIHDTVQGLLTSHDCVNFKEFSLSDEKLEDIKKVLITGCGTSWYAALIGKYIIEEITGIPSVAEIGSELRDRLEQDYKNVLMIGISQSGETVDTVTCVKEAKKRGAVTVGIMNMYASILERVADGCLPVHAGPEISVASTKSFTGSIVALYLLAVYLASGKKQLSNERRKKLIGDVLELPTKVEKAIETEESVERLSRIFFNKKGFLYLARGINYPIACEGAIKMKSLAYKYAEGCAGGEIKHGPIALIDKDTPVVVLIPKDKHYAKSLNDAEEIKARGGTVIAFATEGDNKISKRFKHVLYLPETSYFLTPLIYVIPLQMLAYYVALRGGRGVDRPRNLAKSVTVE